jgi:hypothetical protein
MDLLSELPKTKIKSKKEYPSTLNVSPRFPGDQVINGIKLADIENCDYRVLHMDSYKKKTLFS